MKNKIIKNDLLEEMENMEDNSVDCIITSPPYNMKGNILFSGSSAISVNYNEYDDNMKNEEYEIWQIEFLNECFRVLKKDGHMFYNHKPRYEKGDLIHPLKFIFKSDFILYQEIIWQTRRKVDNTGVRFTPQTERIYWLKKEKIKLNKLEKSYITSDIWNLGRSDKEVNHPASFPLIIPLRIIWSLYGEDKDKIILDPYMGSGTVGVACEMLGHNFVGIDIDQMYVEMAEQRIKNYKSELHKWEEEQKNYIVKKTYKVRHKKG